MSAGHHALTNTHPITYIYTVSHSLCCFIYRDHRLFYFLCGSRILLFFSCLDHIFLAFFLFMWITWSVFFLWLINVLVSFVRTTSTHAFSLLYRVYIPCYSPSVVPLYFLLAFSVFQKMSPRTSLTHTFRCIPVLEPKHLK